MNIKNMPDETLHKYQDLMNESKNDHEIEKNIKEAFEMADKDQDMEISKKELEKVLSADGLSQSAIDRIFDEVDTDKSGEISYKEFVQAIKKKVILEDGF